MPPPRALRGLVNCGNSCFTNVVLQALLASDAFRTLLLAADRHPGHGLLSKFVRLAREMSRAGVGNGAASSSGRGNGFVAGEPLVADWFLDLLPSSGVDGGQEDAEEFLSFVLNGLHEELVEWGGDRGEAVEEERWEEVVERGRKVEIGGGEFVESGVTDIFGGVLRSEILRGGVKSSVMRERFFALSLDIENGMVRDVEHAFRAYFETEVLEGYAMETRKQVLIQELPEVIVLHLKRFSHNHLTGELKKVSRQIPFSTKLEVNEGLIHDGGGVIKGNRNYELIAVVTHIGKDLARGHYTCDVRWDEQHTQHENEKGGHVWVSCDDSKVITTSLQNVLRKQAYLLFYSLQKQL